MVDLAVVVALVVGTSATCSLLEAVLYSVPAARIDALEREGRGSGKLLRRLRTDVDRPIAAILSLNTLANTGGAALAGAIAASVLGVGWIPYFSAAFTLAILFVSEIVPKTAGVLFANELAGPIARPLQVLVVVFAPFIWLSRKLTRLLLSAAPDRAGVSDDELLLMVRRGLSSGDLEEHEAHVIRNILALEGTTAKQIMTPRSVVVSLDTRTTLKEVAANEQLLHHSRIPVYDKDPDDVIGIVHRRDMLQAVARDEFETTLEQLMRPVHFVVETMRVDQLLRTLLDRHLHLVVVTDEFGSVGGIVTLEDVLEEILGHEIVDEFDQVPDLRAFARQQRNQRTTTHPDE
jgi:CBS domain containing-hemolysin-like protein